MGTPAIQTLSKLFIVQGDDKTTVTDFNITNGGKAYEFMSESMARSQQLSGAPGIRGVRSMFGDRVSVLSETVSGSITMQPTYTELTQLLPLFWGPDAGSGVYLPADTLPNFGIYIDRTTKQFIYSNCKVNSASFEFSQSAPMTLSLQIEGEREYVEDTALPIDIPEVENDEKPWIFHQGTLDFGTNDPDFDETNVLTSTFSIGISHNLTTDRFFNNVYRQDMVATDLTVTGSMGLPYTTDEVDLYIPSSADGCAALDILEPTWSLQNCDEDIIQFKFSQLHIPQQTPQGGGRGSEILLNYNWQAYVDPASNDGQLTDAEMKIVLTEGTPP